MNVTGATQTAILTTMMAQQVQQLAQVQEMIVESAVKLAQVSADPNLGQNVDIRA